MLLDLSTCVTVTPVHELLVNLNTFLIKTVNSNATLYVIYFFLNLCTYSVSSFLVLVEWLLCIRSLNPGHIFIRRAPLVLQLLEALKPERPCPVSHSW